MYYDYRESWMVKVSTIGAGVIGIVVLSMLIAFITTQLEKTLYEFRKGRGPVLEKGHTLILGWNERVVDIVRELTIANESERYAAVVILAKESKETMDDTLIKAIPDPKTTRIVTTSGDPANINELARIRAQDASSVIVLASCGASAPEQVRDLSDTQVIKSILGLIAAQGGENRLPVIGEIFGAEQRSVVDLFEDPNIVALDHWEIMGKLLVQTSLSSGLAMVYNEILSFEGSEIYFFETEWNGIAFKDLAYRFRDGVPLGILRDGELMLRPAEDVLMRDGDEILILASDDSALELGRTPVIAPREDLVPTGRRLDKKARKVLILGWHRVAHIFIRESADYLEEGSVFDVLIEAPSADVEAEIHALDQAHPQIAVDLRRDGAHSLEGLTRARPFDYDSVLILSRDPGEQSEDTVDSETLMTLLQLRRIAKQEGVYGSSRTKLITQVLSSENQDLLVQTDIDDFIISNKLITMILAQLSAEPRMRKLYEDIFAEEGSEIYLKPAHLYFEDLPCEISFADAIAVAAKREEICLGVRCGHLSEDATRNFGVRLNLPKDERLQLAAEDLLVVLAEDET